MESLYLTRLKSPKQKSYQARRILPLSQKSLSILDGSTIALDRGDLLRTLQLLQMLSQITFKKAIVATEDEHFNEHKGVKNLRRYSCDLWEPFVGLGSILSRCLTLTQQVKQQVVGAPKLLARKAKEIIDALARTGHGQMRLTTLLNIAPLVVQS